MKSITKAARDLLAALDAYEDDVGERDAADYTEGTADRIYAAKAALREVIADPTPMPAPALGMRAWYSRAESPNPDSARRVAHRDVEWLDPSATWADLVGEYRVPDIDIITDYRTGEVLWRRP